ncbi:AAA family ATPase (plasmid) [Skermanella sp. TT6]|uniref:AAA family ATPase n=1 Tax=Skermanella cutis TaxID=2775420 RepID=A0ABX7BGM3_9PROT|nr:ATP-dependent RecD-like DNA helicase [Skermanella sp. TT6]QQP93537.1 AAA family ATPase [Skermanella sp. TT6]
MDTQTKKKVDLTPDQQQAVRAFRDFMEDSSRKIFYLAGYAGVGKSTMIEQAIAQLGLKAEQVDYVAYTNRATKVLNSKGCPATTIHKAIYKSFPVVDEKATKVAQTKARLAGVKDWASITVPRFVKRFDPQNRLTSKALVVADECSMIGQEQYDDLVKSCSKILFIGDPGQLDPIKDTCPLASMTPDFMLDKILRQKNQSPIILLSMMARNGELIPRGEWGEPGDEAAKYGPSNRDIVGDILAADQALTGKNATRLNWNAAVIKRLYSLALTDLMPTRVGMKMVVRSNSAEFGVTKGDIGILMEPARSVTVTVTKGWGESKRTVRRDALRAMIRFEDGEREVTFWPDNFRDYRVARELPEAVDGVAVLDYGWVCTVHVSQGSSWENVLVLDDGFGRGRGDARQKWLYTAITRAEKSLTIIEGL